MFVKGLNSNYCNRQNRKVTEEGYTGKFHFFYPIEVYYPAKICIINSQTEIADIT